MGTSTTRWGRWRRTTRRRPAGTEIRTWSGAVAFYQAPGTFPAPPGGEGLGRLVDPSGRTTAWIRDQQWEGGEAAG